MSHIIFRYKAVEVATLLMGLLMWPAISAAWDVTGQARAVYASALGVTADLADTGTLNGPSDARDAGMFSGNICNLGNADVMHATTIASGVDTVDSVASEASAGDLNLGVAGNFVSADFVMAEAFTPAGGASSGSTLIDGLSINGLQVTATGAPNQTIDLIGGRIVINEQQVSASGIVVNALHIVVDGVADVVIASAASGVAASTTPVPSPVPLPIGGSVSLF